VTSLISAGAIVGFVSAPAGAVGSVLVSETFANSTTASSGWQKPAGSGAVCLTAGTNTSATPLVDCDVSPDANGSGALQLTNNAGGQVGTVYSNVALPTANGLDATWNSYQFNGTGADGISFDLASVNPSDPVAPATVGPAGGALGYAGSSSNGVPYGYLGFGADVYGNFENSTTGGSGCGQNQGAVAESMGVRGPGDGTTGYCLLSQINFVSGTTLDNQGATSRGTGASGVVVPEEVVLNTTSSTVIATASGVSVPANDWMFATKPLVAGVAGTVWHDALGALPTNPIDVPTSWVNTTTGFPKELAFGFASSTGGATEFHQINNLVVNSLTASPTLALTNTDSGGGTLPANSAATVTLTASVPSASAASENHTVVVSDTLPSSLTPTAASGTNWTCTATGQVVSCSYTGTLPISPGTTLPAIAISVTTSPTVGPFTNSAQASSSDGAPATATDAGTIVTAPQAIIFTNTPPTAASVGSSYSVTATGGASGNPVTYSVDGSSTSGCTVNATTGLVTMSAPAGTCVIDANQAGNATYSAAPQVHQASSSRSARTQAITFTNTPPTAVAVGATYSVSSTGGASGNPVTYSVDGSSTSGCTVNATTGLVTMSAPAGTCVIDANQAGNAVFAAAALAQQSSSSAPGAPTATIASPSTGATYRLGQRVTTTFSCVDATGGPGIASCSDGRVTSGTGSLATSSVGHFTYRVTATSKDGQSSTTVLNYQVVAPSSALVLYYGNNSSVLTAQSMVELNAMARVISSDHLSQVVLSGYASSTGTSARNSVLGMQRAQTAGSYLAARLSALNVQGVSTHVDGYGASRFRVRPDSAAGNRRTVIVAT
jgi:outer membrane protein OmpA-like peptidoglycan-associated protein